MLAHSSLEFVLQRLETLLATPHTIQTRWAASTRLRLRRRGGYGGDRVSMLGAKEEGATHYRVMSLVFSVPNLGFTYEIELSCP
jgi:hypothetical protein